MDEVMDITATPEYQESMRSLQRFFCHIDVIAMQVEKGWLSYDMGADEVERLLRATRIFKGHRTRMQAMTPAQRMALYHDMRHYFGYSLHQLAEMVGPKRLVRAR